jgi:hypothetical protein
MLSERRTQALRDLAARVGKAQTIEETCALAAQTLSLYQLDIPFALFYLLEAEGKRTQADCKHRLSGRDHRKPKSSGLKPAAFPFVLAIS